MLSGKEELAAETGETPEKGGLHSLPSFHYWSVVNDHPFCSLSLSCLLLPLPLPRSSYSPPFSPPHLSDATKQPKESTDVSEEPYLALKVVAGFTSIGIELFKKGKELVGSRCGGGFISILSPLAWQKVDCVERLVVVRLL